MQARAKHRYPGDWPVKMTHHVTTSPSPHPAGLFQSHNSQLGISLSSKDNCEIPRMQRVAAETACAGLMAVLLAGLQLTSPQKSRDWLREKCENHAGNIGKPCQTKNIFA